MAHTRNCAKVEEFSACSRAAEFCSGEIQLRAEDRLVLFTDGLLEAHDSDGEEFGAKRILEEGLSLRTATPAACLDGIFARVREFRRAGI